jgi:hypothetical protein
MALTWEPHRLNGSRVSKAERSQGGPVSHQVHGVVWCGEINGCCALFVVATDPSRLKGRHFSWIARLAKLMASRIKKLNDENQDDGASCPQAQLRKSSALCGGPCASHFSRQDSTSRHHTLALCTPVGDAGIMCPGS